MKKLADFLGQEKLADFLGQEKSADFLVGGEIFWWDTSFRILENGLLSQMTSELFRIKFIFMTIMQYHYHNTIKDKVKDITEEM